MSPNERLTELQAIRYNNVSARTALIRTTNDRSRRTRLVHQSVKRIRSLFATLKNEFDQLRYIRSCSEDRLDSVIYQQIDHHTARIAELDKEIALVGAEARVERLLKLSREINRLKREVGDPDTIDEDMILS